MQIKIHPQSMQHEDWFPRMIYIPAARERSFREWAERNHGQAVERLNQRGGLGVSEIWAIYHGKRWERLTPMQHIEALKLCVELSVEARAEEQGGSQ